MAVRTRLELATPCVTGMYSNQTELPDHLALLKNSRCFSIASAKIRQFFIVANIFFGFLRVLIVIFCFTAYKEFSFFLIIGCLGLFVMLYFRHFRELSVLFGAVEIVVCLLFLCKYLK